MLPFGLKVFWLGTRKLDYNSLLTWLVNGCSGLWCSGLRKNLCRRSRPNESRAVKNGELKELEIYSEFEECQPYKGKMAVRARRLSFRPPLSRWLPPPPLRAEICSEEEVPAGESQLSAHHCSFICAVYSLPFSM